MGTPRLGRHLKLIVTLLWVLLIAAASRPYRILRHPGRVRHRWRPYFPLAAIPMRWLSNRHTGKYGWLLYVHFAGRVPRR